MQMGVRGKSLMSTQKNKKGIEEKNPPSARVPASVLLLLLLLLKAGKKSLHFPLHFLF